MLYWVFSVVSAGPFSKNMLVSSLVLLQYSKINRIPEETTVYGYRVDK